MLERLDKMMVQQGLAASRTQAQRLIEAGAVKGRLQGQWLTLNKAAMKISSEVELHTQAIDELRYVSRAGLKLSLALEYLQEQALWPVPSPLQNAFVLDVGQSTGGFTDCAIQHGAQRVVGVDVGHGQLAAALRGNPKVVCLEGVNARTLPSALATEYTPTGFDIAVMDVSFISQRLLIDSVVANLKSNGWLLSLVKPQFEVGKDGIGKGGIVKDEALFDQVEQVICSCLKEHNMRVSTYFSSGLDGSDGNREFFVLAQKTLADASV